MSEQHENGQARRAKRGVAAPPLSASGQCEHGVPYPHLDLELPRTGWQVLTVQAGMRVFRHRCANCGYELFYDCDQELAGAQLLALIQRHGVPPLCIECLLLDHDPLGRSAARREKAEGGEAA